MGLWIAFLAIWAIGATRTKQTTRLESVWSQVEVRALTVAGIILFIIPGTGVGWLGRQLLPDSALLAYAAVALTFIGIAFAVWARFVLGSNWSALVTIKKDHELIQRGPYALARHPIYSGVLLALVGSALNVDQVRGLIAWALMLAGFWLKSRTEEGFMIQQFGDQYRRYRREVKALIPFVL